LPAVCGTPLSAKMVAAFKRTAADKGADAELN
jgi:hypothetical protein